MQPSSSGSMPIRPLASSSRIVWSERIMAASRIVRPGRRLETTLP